MAGILIVEDERKRLRSLERGLRASRSPRPRAVMKATALASGGTFDVLVLDLMLPGRSGLEILADLRRNRNAVLASILEECGRIGRLTDQLLALAREDTGAARPAAPLDLSRLVLGVADELRPLAEAKGQRLAAAADGPAWVRGDELRLR